MDFPRTVARAAECVVRWLAPEGRGRLAALSEQQLIETHFGLAMTIRNRLGLCGGNKDLLAATGEDHPDSASGVIVCEAWARLRRPH